MGVSARWVMVLLLAGLGMRAGWAEEPVSFRKSIAPLLVDKCLGCHNAEKSEGKYSMDTFENLLKGGEQGKPFEPGKPEDSLASKMIHGTAEPAMPFEDDKLPDADLAVFDKWIREGAKFDGTHASVPLEELIAPEKPKTIDRGYRTPVPIAALAFRPDGGALAASGYHEICFWQPTDGKLLARWETKRERIADIEFSKDGKYLVHVGGTPGRNGEAVVWDVAAGKPLRTLIEFDDVCYAASFRPNAPEVAVGGTDRIFRVFQIENGQQLHSVENHADWILGLTYTPDGKRLLSASRDRSAKVWDQVAAEPIVTFSQHTDGVYAVASTPDGTTALSAGADKKVRLWKTDGNGDQTAAIDAHDDAITCLTMAPSGKFFVTAAQNGKIRLWNPADNKMLRELAGHGDAVCSLALSADETLLASGGWDGEIRVWNTTWGEIVTKFVAVPALSVAERPASP